MLETITIGDLVIDVTRKDVKNVHLSVHPPYGRVTLVAPTNTRLDVARAYAVSKLPWIRGQQQQLIQQARETPRQLVERESHFLWGRRYLLSIVEQDAKPRVEHDHKRIVMYVRPGADIEQRRGVLHQWHRKLLHATVPGIIEKWEPKIGRKVNQYFLQRMKTKWGACNHAEQNIRLNTELVRKPKDLLEYVIVHEMVHLIEPTHNERFVEILAKLIPNWRDCRTELNELPLGHESWK
jgi:predicted metal-dependent hydrolase